MITTETLKRLEFDKILIEIASHAHSDVTRELIMAIAPLADSGRIRLISGRISEIRSLAGQGVGLRLTEFDDIRPLLEVVRPSGAFLSPAELLLLIPALRNCSDIARQLAPRHDIPLLKSLEPVLKPFPEILEPLTASIDNDAGILDSASPQLREIRRAKRSLAARIRKKIEEIVRDNNIEIFLQDDFITQRSGRWVIPVRMDSKGMVKGIVHDVSASGETAFMEPLEIIPFVNELENLSAEEKAEEIRILRQLSAWIREDASALEGCFATLTALDLLNSIAGFAGLYDLETPVINENGELVLHQARHPLLLLQVRRGGLARVEALDMALGKDKNGVVRETTMVITGPNAGGKTIALKTAGVLTLMALCAIPVPANGVRSTFPLLDTLLVDIGDEQSIEQSLSTFSAHVARVSTILDQSGPRSLVLLDELGAGTEPQQGAAIACAVLHDLQERGATVIATTHLSEIIGYVHRTPGMINAGMEYDTATYTPLYRLISGEPGHSHALEIARRYGLPERVVDRAREMLGNAGAEFTSLLAELRQKREELDHMRAFLERQQEDLQRKRQEVENRATAIEQARREATDKAWSEARELISTTRRRMNELLDEYKREKRSEIIDKLRQSETDLTAQFKERPEPGRTAEALKEIKTGTRVHVASLGHDGLILSIDERHNKARVRAGSMEVEVAFSDLGVPLKREKRPVRKPEQSVWKIESADSEEREIKLIGLRVEEALDQLEPFLNRAALAGIQEVRIIHGLGTGRLRDAVREHLARHPLVEEYRSGAPHEGREGATVVKLRS
ncbi:MAG TPA: endonuclease MutS2 [Desulfuromonadaceae bacterium]|jgi:DNA mismatch repair protein MutS2